MATNAAPEFIALGADDQSARALLAYDEPLPQHLPKVFILAAKGPTKPVLASSARLQVLYGKDTFDYNNKYFNHATRFLVGMTGTGNTCMVQRVVPSDAGVKSNVAIYIDVLPTKVPKYIRDSLGNYVVDSTTNDYKTDGTIDGYMIKFIREHVTSGSEEQLGLLSSKNGTMSDGSTTSTMYPLLQFRAAYQGEAYNNIGIAITSLFKEAVDTKIVSKTNSIPFGLSLYTRDNEATTPVVLRSLFGEPVVNFSFKNKAINPNTDARMDLEYVFNNNWYNETDGNKRLRYNDFDGMYFYRSNYELVLNKILSTEKAYVSSTDQVWADNNHSSTMAWFDYSTADSTAIMDEIYVMNIFACKSSRNVKYFTVMISEETPSLTGTQKEINIGSGTPVWMSGGSDGTLDVAHYEEQVVNEMNKYLDPDSEVQDLAINVESILYDSGFTLATKKELTSFIGIRKDTVLVLSTHEATMGENYLNLSDSRAVGIALQTRLKLVPESEYYGTGVARALVVVGSGILRDSTSSDRVAATYEIAVKAARMMGAGNGSWNATYLFDKAPGNMLEYLIDYQPSFIPSGVKPNLWVDGLVWAQPYDRVNYHFPALQTVYSDDTSVLNNFFTVVALSEVTKVAARAWRNFTGSTRLTAEQFTDAVTAYCVEQFKSRFAGMIVVVPEAILTDEDKVLGYSWHLVNKVYANNMKTVCTYTTEVYRMSDLEV
jgi:hypothetical protein